MAEAQRAAERLLNYFKNVGEDAAYPEGFDPEEDARLVSEALAEE